MPSRDDQRGDRRGAQTQPIVTDEHLAAAAQERERSQSRTKFFTPVDEPDAAATPQPEGPRPTVPQAGGSPSAVPPGVDRPGAAGAGQADAATADAGQGAVPQAGISQLVVPQVAAQHGGPQVGTPQVGPPRAGSPQVGTAPHGSPQVGPPPMGTPTHGTPQAGPPQVGGSPQVGAPRAGTQQAGTQQPGTPLWPTEGPDEQPDGQDGHRQHGQRGLAQWVAAQRDGQRQDHAHRQDQGQRPGRPWWRPGVSSLPGARPVTEMSRDATYGPALPQESTVQLVLDLALRIGEVQMASGAGASDTTASIQAVAGAYGLPHCEVDVIFSSITVSVHRGTDVNPITAVRLVRSRGQNYTRLEATERLLRRIAAGKIRVYEASAELDRITRAPHPYPRWTGTLAWAGMAASIAVLIGGDGLLASLSAIIAAVVDRLGRYLNHRALPAFFQQVVGGLLATVLALGLADSHLFAGLGKPQLVIGAAVTVLLSGLSVVSTVQDAVTGYYVTAAGRTMEIALSSAGLIGGVVAGLKLSAMVGLANVAAPAPSVASALDLPKLTIAGAAAAVFFALASSAHPRSLLVAGIAGALGAVSYGILQTVNAGPIASPAIAAVVIGFSGGVLARRLRIPPVIVAVAGLTPLLPGLSTYRALYEIAVAQHTTAGMQSLVVAATIALALGAGVVLGEFLAQPVRHGLGRLERRFAPAGPTWRRDR